MLFSKKDFFVYLSAKSGKSQVLDSCDDYTNILNKTQWNLMFLKFTLLLTLFSNWDLLIITDIFDLHELCE